VENAISGGDPSIEELYRELSVEDLYNFEAVSDNWQPRLNLIAPLPTPVPWRDPEDPLELFAINSVKNPNPPVYVVQVGPPKATYPANAAQFVLVRTILDTGAEANYITLHKAHLAKAQLFSINTQEIVGAGCTTTSAFAHFALKIGGFVTPCVTILDTFTYFYSSDSLPCMCLNPYDSS